ncbi:hypothetical protein C1646_758715 [Rhizophagus diaphanus]|nr:hypothetical protein C1646_758715 [Rhizophagus diaphanus] [Rhizophagus sp. MUCL 43196]
MKKEFRPKLLIEYTQKMEFVPYDQFKKIEFIAEGKFNKIYKATTWIDGPIKRKYIPDLNTRDSTIIMPYYKGNKLNNLKHITNRLINIHNLDIIHRDLLSAGWVACYVGNDIYSFGTIMWEFTTSCRRSFWDRKHVIDLIIDIIDGSRPPIAPEGYIERMQAF